LLSETVTLVALSLLACWT